MLSRPYSLTTLILLAVFLVLLVGTQGAAKKVIVDDADTRILYSPDGWATQGTCPSCFPQLDMNQVHDRTWHFSNNTANSGFTFFFTGTSLELRYIASDTVQMLAERVSYSIDGTQYGIAAQSQHLNPISFAYEQSLFSVTGLPNTAHVLQVNIVQASSVMFDYLIYDDQDVVVPISTNIPAISTPNVNPISVAGSTNAALNASPNSNNPTGATNVANITPNAGVSNIVVASINTITSNIIKVSSPTSTTGTINIILNTNTNSSPTASSTSSPEVSPSNSGSTSNVKVGAIVGGVVSGVALLALGFVFWRFFKRRRGAQLDDAPAHNEPTEATAPAFRYFSGHPKYRHLMAETNHARASLPLDQPVEAGLMSRSRYPTIPSDGSRRTLASA